MRTEDLIRQLAAGAARDPSVPGPGGAARLVRAALGLLVAAGAVSVVLFGLRPDLPAALLGAPLLLKLALLGGILAAALAGLGDRLVPGRAGRRVPALGFGVALGAALLLGLAALGEPLPLGLALLCAARVGLLGLVAGLVLALVAARGLPLDPARGGALAGLGGGAVAGLGYSVFCTLDGGGAILAGYLAPSLLLGLAGLLAGRRLLA